MPSQFIPLVSGAYQTRSLIGAAQRCVNLVVEQIPIQAGEPTQGSLFVPNYVHYPRAGLTLEGFGQNATLGWRCLYTDSQGTLWGVNGSQVFWIEESGNVNLVGALTPSTLDDVPEKSTPVSMVDNGELMLIVDGSTSGWFANVKTHDGLTPFSASSNPPAGSAAGATMSGWPGGTRAEYSDTFFIVNQPGGFEFYTSDSEAVTWNPLNFASKVAKPDPLQVCVVVQRVLIVLGTQSLEGWINSGGSGASAIANNTFPYSAYPTFQFDIGCVAPYSVAVGTQEVFWLSLNKYGQGLVYRLLGQNVNEVSTYYISYQISQYERIDDAIGMIFQQAGHTYYMLSFPTQDKTWVYDLSNQQWAEWTWNDDNGIEHRHRANCVAAAYGKIYAGDWANSNVYSIDPTNHTDNGQEIRCVRAWPHQLDIAGNARINFRSLIARVQVGSSLGSSNQAPFLNTSFDNPDDTLLQNFSNTNELGATFSKLTGDNIVILDNAATGSLDGTSLYQIGGTATVADYTLTYSATPTGYVSVQPNGSALFVIGRANSSNNGYQAEVSSDGSQYHITLNVMDTATTQTLALGTIASGFYSVTLSMQAEVISVAVQRSVDGNWLAPSGTWVGSYTLALSLNDGTYTAIGNNLLGGTWAS